MRSCKSRTTLMEATGLEEPFWYIIISTGGTFIILATTVLVFVICRYQQDKNAASYDAESLNRETIYTSGTISKKNDIWCQQEVELRLKTPDDALSVKEDILPFNSFAQQQHHRSYPDGTATLPTRHRMNTKQWCQEQRAKEQAMTYMTLRHQTQRKDPAEDDGSKPCHDFEHKQPFHIYSHRPTEPENRNTEQFRSNNFEPHADLDTDFNIKSMGTSHDMLSSRPEMTDATSIADGFSTYQRTPTHQSNFIIYPKPPATPLTSYYSTPTTTTSKGPNLVLNEYANSPYKASTLYYSSPSTYASASDRAKPPSHYSTYNPTYHQRSYGQYNDTSLSSSRFSPAGYNNPGRQYN